MCYKAQKSLEGIETRILTVFLDPFNPVTKHRNPWKGLKPTAPPTLDGGGSCRGYKAQKSLEGIETPAELQAP